jgi:hypothetical protein
MALSLARTASEFAAIVEKTNGLRLQKFSSQQSALTPVISEVE